jgi:hypothetical protein
MTELTGIFKEIEGHTYTSDKCFLCGCLLTKENKTAEHVIPKWIQKRFNLWDERIHLMNGATFPYRNITIPCCFQCNNKYLGPFERRILKAFNSGYDSFKRLNLEIIFLWIGKIYFGMIYKELFLNADVRNPGSGTITNPCFLKSFYTHFLFLQELRGKHKFKDFFPASIFIFKTQVPTDIKEQWDYRDNNNSLFISIRMADIGLIAVLQDGQATQQFESDLAKYMNIGLHPLQFNELTAQIFYKSLLFNRTPKYMNSQVNDKVETIQMSLQGLSNKPIFDDWNPTEYANILSNFTGVPKVQPESNKIITWLHDEKGRVRIMKIME